LILASAYLFEDIGYFVLFYQIVSRENIKNNLEESSICFGQSQLINFNECLLKVLFNSFDRNDN